MNSINISGYKIIKANNIKFLNKVKKEYFKIANQIGFDGTPNALNEVKPTQLNKLNLNFNRNSKNVNFNLVNAFSKEIKKILGKKIFLQRLPYLRAKKNDLKSTATVPHNDCDYGHSHLGFNLWVPLFDILDNEGIFIFDIETSKKIYSTFKFDKHLSIHIANHREGFKKKYIKLKYGEAILFSNLCIHGATTLEKKINRVSSNIHLQSFDVPMGEKSSDLFTIAQLNTLGRYTSKGI